VGKQHFTKQRKRKPFPKLRKRGNTRTTLRLEKADTRGEMWRLTDEKTNEGRVAQNAEEIRKPKKKKRRRHEGKHKKTRNGRIKRGGSQPKKKRGSPPKTNGLLG